MSVTTDIVCTSCKEKLWIGQSDYIYLIEDNIMKKLNDFLQKHRTDSSNEHKLLFIDEHWDIQYEDGWKDYE
jgi:hypothetical protein